MNHDILFSWIHISDMHMGHGDARNGLDQKLVLQALRDDIEKLARDLRPSAVFVTGDIGFSGATKKLTEYQDAREWLISIAKAAGLEKKDIFVVPGNHDIQRDLNDRDLQRLVRALRIGEEELDTALANDKDAVHLKKRLANYLDFAKDFAPAAISNSSKKENRAGMHELFWIHEIEREIKIRIIGFNTALLSANDQDQGKLRLGKQQLADTLVVLLGNIHKDF
jgi:predicted MPP superfamily phosphohydrolase